eukprot:TRINITY_DN2111_c1_g1_i1.p1 TRINITY_DN2111_c1_g1~~TRINITY_DN2111_c1_g1_i1.p1  ORF type:complete len:540 (+),score=97.83 TRINITY_DN2111_c1_g1_i1:43-1620(+)
MEATIFLLLMALVGMVGGTFSIIPLDDWEIKNLTTEINIERCMHGAPSVMWSESMKNKAEMNCNGDDFMMGGDNRLFLRMNAAGVWIKGMATDFQRNQFYELEKANYDFKTGKAISAPGSPIHDFAQTVWELSTHFGCTVCQDDAQPSPYTSFVCNYNNWIVDIQDSALNSLHIKPASQPRDQCLMPKTNTMHTSTITLVEPTETVIVSTPEPGPLGTDSPTPTQHKTDTPTQYGTPLPMSSGLYPWRCVGIKFRSAWPKQLSLWLPKVVATLYSAWNIKPQPPFDLAVTYVCPLIDGKKPSGDKAKQVCTPINDGTTTTTTTARRKLLAETMEELATLGELDGVFIETQITDVDFPMLDKRTSTLREAASKATQQKPPFYDTSNPPNLLVMSVIEMSNGADLIVTQEGGPGSRPSTEIIEDMQEPPPDTESPFWWLYLAMGGILFLLLAGVVSLLVMKKRSAASHGNAVVTVSEFYRAMPEGYAVGPIPEEHYGNEEYNSSVEIECHSRPRNSSLGMVQPLGRI